MAFGGGSGQERMVVYSPDGKIERVLSSRPTRNPALSPRGDQIVATGQDSQAGVWLIDLDRDVSTRLAAGNVPIWSPDATAIAYGSNGELGIRDLFIRSVGANPEEKLLLHTAEPKIINDWTRDGKYIVFASVTPDRRVDLWLLPMFGDRKPIPYLRSGSTQIQAQVSPDGHWAAYSSDESGQWEVYLQSFPVPGMKRIVSVGGGGEPHWSDDGRQLFYMRADKTLMAVQIHVSDPPNVLGPSKPRFTVPVVGDTTSFRSRYIVDSKANRFLFNAIDESQQVPITVIANWTALDR
jgi:Tol biopolymer transport system component